MANLKTAREFFRKASAQAEAGNLLASAQLSLAAFHQAQGSKAKGAKALAYRLWNATTGTASVLSAVTTDDAERIEAARIIAEATAAWTANA